MQNLNPSDRFHDISFYSAHFMDPQLWEPYVRYVTASQGLEVQRILPGLAGTFPTFIVELSKSPKPDLTYIVIKFFGPLFEGRASFEVEQEVGDFFAQKPLCIHTPVILGKGNLNPDWSFLVFEYISGVSLGQVRPDISKDAMEKIAQQMGKFMRELHTLTANPQTNHPLSHTLISWEDYATFLDTQREACLQNHRSWQDLPAHLIEQIPGFISPIDQLIDFSSPPHLIHADLTADHLLGRLHGSHSSSLNKPDGDFIDTPGLTQSPTNWETLAVIDWGDCRVGNILYELVALHMDLFQVDKFLLEVCLNAYGLSSFYQSDFARKALSTVLLHQFPMPANLYDPYLNVPTLYDLAEGIFDALWVD